MMSSESRPSFSASCSISLFLRNSGRKNRYALFLELLCPCLAQFRTENRYALFLELLSAAGPSDLSTPAASLFP